MYIGIPNDNKKVILVRNTGVASNSTTTSDKDANWRSLFKDILKTAGSDTISNIVGIPITSDSNIDAAAKSTEVNPNVSLLMTNQVEDLSTNNDFNPVMTTVEKGFDSFKSFFGTENSTGIKNLLSTVVGGVGVGYELLNQITHNLGADDNPDNGAASNKSLMPWFTNVKAWKKESANISFRYTFNFAMGQYGLWNAREEVFLPILNLMAPTLIRNLTTFTTTGPYPTAAAMIMKAFDGKSDEDEISSELNSELYKTGMGAIEKLIVDSYKGFSYSIAFGNFIKFNKVIIENSSYSFSQETDQFGYPISGSITLNFSSIVPISLTASSEHTLALRLGSN